MHQVYLAAAHDTSETGDHPENRPKVAESRPLEDMDFCSLGLQARWPPAATEASYDWHESLRIGFPRDGVEESLSPAKLSAWIDEQNTDRSLLKESHLLRSRAAHEQA